MRWLSLIVKLFFLFGYLDKFVFLNLKLTPGSLRAVVYNLFVSTSLGCLNSLIWFSCFKLFFLVEIASFINIFNQANVFHSVSKVPDALFLACNYEFKSFSFPGFINRRHAIQVVLLKVLRLSYTKEFVKILFNCITVQVSINSCFFSDIFLFVYDVWFLFWCSFESSWCEFFEWVLFLIWLLQIFVSLLSLTIKSLLFFRLCFELLTGMNELWICYS